VGHYPKAVVTAVRAGKQAELRANLLQVTPAAPNRRSGKAVVSANPEIVRGLIKSKSFDRFADFAFHGFALVGKNP
jgi:hypothetical protein